MQHFFQHLLVLLAVLPYVEPGEVEAEGADPVEPRLHVGFDDPPAAVRGNAVGQELHIGFQFPRGGIRSRAGAGALLLGERLLQPVADDGHPGAADFVGRDQVQPRLQLGPFLAGLFDRRAQALVGRRLTPRHHQHPAQVAAGLQLSLDGALAQQSQRFASDFAGDVGISVAVAAHPSADPQETGDLQILLGVVLPQRLSQFSVDLRHHVPQSRGEEQTAADFVEHFRRTGAEHVRLP